VGYTRAGLERWIDMLESGQAVHGAADAPPEEEAAALERWGVGSMLALPLFVDGRWFGFIGLEHVRAHAWSEAETMLLAPVADMIGAFIKRAYSDDALRRSEERLRSVVENMPVMVAAFDETGTIRLWNRECERVTGFRAVEVVGNPHGMEMLYPDPDYRRLMLAEWAERGNDLRDWEWLIQCKNGTRKLISWSSIATQFPIAGWASWGVGVDITERARVEHLVIRAKREWERTFDSVPDCIAILDRDYRVRRLNQALADRLRVHPRDAVGLHLKHVVDPPENAGEVSARIRLMADGDSCSVQEMPIRRLGGHFLVTVCPYELEEEGRIGSILVAHDVTRWKQLEEQLHQSQKMEALGTLAGGIAHDFNNILGVILGYTEMVQAGLETDSAPWRRAGEIMAAGHRARDLVNQILTFSRQSVQEMRPLRLGPLVKETLKLLEAAMPANVEMRQHLLTDQDTVTADPTHVHQILMNLCTNAAQAMGPDGGSLEVGLVDSFLEMEGMPGFPRMEVGPYVRLSVRDSGPGMTDEVAERIFDPFFTTKKPGEGTGMGLAVVHGIVEKLGGGISVDTAPGQGTTMHVFLPRTDLPAHTLVDLEEPLPMGSGRILLVDDERALAEIGAEILESLGYDVQAFTSSTHALESFRLKPELWDLVLTDQIMPELSGLEMVEQMRAERPNLPVILTTGFSESMAFERARELGVRAFIVKPVLRRQLAQTIRDVLAGEDTILGMGQG
jgi:PAS domain S-box-containing protein